MKETKAETMADLIGNLTSCFENLVRAGKELGSVSKSGNSFWGLLKILDTAGPLTVPNLAKQRKLSRQRVQVLVDEYVAEGYLKLTTNPNHKTSKLVSLTTLGESELRKYNRLIQAHLNSISEDFDEEELKITAVVLTKLNNRIGIPKP